MRAEMSVKKTLLTVFALLALAPGAAFAAPGDQARPRLVANVKTVKPGETFRVGVLIELSPGWHIYWKNPGESGIATTVAFRGNVTPVEFPTPDRLDLEGGIVSYGYTDKVLL